MSAKYLEDYAKINARLKFCTKEFLNRTEYEKMNFLFSNAKYRKESGYPNQLIATATKRDISQTYRALLSEVNGKQKIGTVEIEEQADGITAMSILMLLTNRLSKDYQYQLNHSSDLLEDEKKNYEDKIDKMYYWKNETISELLASIYVLKETSKKEESDIDYANFFSYGHNADKKSVTKEATDAFVIDLPYYGQIGVHFGNRQVMEMDIRRAKRKVRAILNEKQKLGQLTREEKEKVMANMTDDTIFPKYQGIFYEYNSALPTDYINNRIKTIRNTTLNGKVPENITSKDIQILYDNERLNSREIRYLGIKIGFSKPQLDWLDKMIQENEKTNTVSVSAPFELNTKIIGKEAMEVTNAEEREKIAWQEENFQQEEKENQYLQNDY